MKLYALIAALPVIAGCCGEPVDLRQAHYEQMMFLEQMQQLRDLEQQVSQMLADHQITELVVGGAPIYEPDAIVYKKGLVTNTIDIDVPMYRNGAFTAEKASVLPPGVTLDTFDPLD